MRTVIVVALAASAVGILFADSIHPAHSQSPGDGSSHDQTLVPRGNEKSSFDCAKAKTAAARLICADGELARLDGELGGNDFSASGRLPCATSTSPILL